jgi:hypothetical protein
VTIREEVGPRSVCGSTPSFNPQHPPKPHTIHSYGALLIDPYSSSSDRSASLLGDCVSALPRGGWGRKRFTAPPASVTDLVALCPSGCLRFGVN